MFILKANHNKDYSVVKTFRAALLSKRRSLFFEKLAKPLDNRHLVIYIIVHKCVEN